MLASVGCPFGRYGSGPRQAQSSRPTGAFARHDPPPPPTRRWIGAQARRLKARRFNGSKVNIRYGMGCERVGGFVGHNGAIYGYTSVVFAYPPADLVLAVVGNESNNNTTPTTTFAYQFIQKYFPDQWQP